jgi:hypothetical protein
MRSQLRIADLKGRTKSTIKMMNVRVPGRVFEAIEALTKKLRATKTDVIAALLNEGLDVAGKKRGGRHRK